MDIPNREQELTQYIAVLREALQMLVDAAIRHQEMRRTPLPSLFTMYSEIDYAQQVLRIETGRHAEQELQLLTDLNDHAYILADYLHHQLYGTMRAPKSGVPNIHEVKAALAGIESTTQAAWKLEALLLPDSREEH